MKVVNSHPIQYLTLDNLAINPRLARRLPPTLAFRYHALPIAKDNDHFTVAMANPNDQAACAAIATGLGARPYVVQADPVAIDRQLAKIWPEEIPLPSLHILVHHQDSPIADKIAAYAQRLGELLHGQLNHYQTSECSKPNFDDLVEKASRNQDLVIFGEPNQSLIKRLLVGPAGCRATERLPTSVLVTRQPRWPLKRILLVTRGYETDNMAVDWLVRLAQPSKAIVTVLALVPPSSATCQRAASYMPHGLADWLGTTTPLGRQLRRIAQQLVNWEVIGQLRFRQGSPDQQIQREVAEVDYDLIVIATDPSDWWLRRLLGEVVNPLLRWVDRPVLIAKSTLSPKGGAGNNGQFK